MTRLKFADPASIASVKEYEDLISLVETYRDLTLRKRGTKYRGQPVRKVSCRLCAKEISAKQLYYSVGKRSAHDACVDKAHDRKRELDPVMGAA